MASQSKMLTVPWIITTYSKKIPALHTCKLNRILSLLLFRQGRHKHLIWLSDSIATCNTTNTENPTAVLQSTMHKAKGTLRANLFRTLATKDAARYLCSHLAISSPTDSAISGVVPGLGNIPIAGSTSLRADDNPRTTGNASLSSPLLM
ncbi:hypothetical protein BKA82DRAFT_238710 [Pisolithus tinctorius]|uniref:Uncharacterized protein n=1 Tax=Pisolithus tinctorius Marx 270 TaxID=870435 RepID=A0A0C3IHT0_PISTI|nr:hypothetical protein BKA82DRAFT_238710 [Pisolithus tinctorius]KIN96587.1 hypothetical protein M404DRAFT_238710 [Pisolithus tinctorius Marx 270]